MNKLTFKQRFVALIAVIVVAFCGLTAFLLSRQAATAENMQSLHEKDYNVASRLAQIDGLLTRVDINILRMLALNDASAIPGWKAQNAERFSKAEQAIAEMKTAADPSLANAIRTMEEAYRLMRRGMENQVQAIEAGDLKGAGEINRTQVRDNADKTFGTLAELKAAEDQLVQRKVEGQLASTGQIRMVSLLLSVCVALGAIGLSYLLIRSLLQPLAQALAAAQRIAAGDLSVSLNNDGRDEMAQLLRALSGMQTSLAGIVHGVRSGAENVATASAQIAQGNQDLSGRTETQASSLQQTAATMEELGNTVRHNAENARQASQLAESASSVALQGGEVVGRVVTTMQGINDSSRKIGDIISVIDGIAFQTNILALNAAVEAARAGEQGRGFAVVASEVRSLAQRSAEAAKEIKSLIGRSVEQVEQGTTLVDQAGQTMGEIVASIQRVTNIVAEISSASGQQSSGVQQVGQTIGQMDQATQQNAALVEESAAAADSLTRQAQQLVDAVAVFKLSQGMVPTPPARTVAAVAPVTSVKAAPAVRVPAPARTRAVTRSSDKPQPAAARNRQVALAAKPAQPIQAAKASNDEWESF